MENQFKDRIGVNFVERIVLQEFQWIFRDQPIMDLGIDAYIEIVSSIESQHEYLMIAGLQIKSGIGNFYEKDECLRYYASQRHYKYWSKSSIPVLILAVLPQKGITYWQVASKENFTKSKKGYFIDIPKLKVFGKEQKEEILEEIQIHFDSFNFKYGLAVNYSEYTALDYIYSIKNQFKEVRESIEMLCKVLENFGNKLNSITFQIEDYDNKGILPESPRGKRLIKKFATELSKFKRRFSIEINDSIELLGDGTRLFLNFTTMFLDNHGNSNDAKMFVRPELNRLLFLLKEGQGILKDLLNSFEVTTAPDLKKVDHKIKKAVNALLKEYKIHISSFEDLKGETIEYIDNKTIISQD